MGVGWIHQLLHARRFMIPRSKAPVSAKSPHEMLPPAGSTAFLQEHRVREEMPFTKAVFLMVFFCYQWGENAVFSMRNITTLLVFLSDFQKKYHKNAFL